GACRSMYPHGRSLVKQFEGKPFALLGVNSDPDRGALRSVMQKEQITWRSFWDNGSAPGPIAKQWGVRGWATLYLIDHNGVIREKFLGSPGEKTLNRLIDQLIAKAQN